MPLGGSVAGWRDSRLHNLDGEGFLPYYFIWRQFIGVGVNVTFTHRFSVLFVLGNSAQKDVRNWF